MQANKINDAIFYMLVVFALVSCISINGGRISTIVAALVGLIYYIKHRPPVNLDGTPLKAAGIFLAVAALTGIFGHEPLKSLNRVLEVGFRIVPFMLVLIFVKDIKRIYMLAGSLMLSMLIADFWAIWQGFNGNLRASGLSTVMTFAGYLIQTIPLMLAMTIERKQLSGAARSGLYLTAFISFVALGYNGTRGAWIAIFAVIVLLGLINLKRKRFVVWTMLFIMILSAIILATPVVKERVMTIGDTQEQSHSERILIWKSAWNMFLDHPFTGIGTGNFAELYHQKYILPQAKEPHLTHAHNNIMHILAENGVPGIAAFVYLFGYILLSTLQSYRTNPSNRLSLAAFLVTIGFLIHGLTEYNFDNSSATRIYWFILGLAYTERNLRRVVSTG